MMNKEQVLQYLHAKPEVVETLPYGQDTHVFKVKNKMFALLGQRNEMLMINLKCDPEQGVALRKLFPAITPGYHMDKKHWISVYFDDSVPEDEIKRLIDSSFNLVVANMAKIDQQSILVHL